MSYLKARMVHYTFSDSFLKWEFRIYIVCSILPLYVVGMCSLTIKVVFFFVMLNIKYLDDTPK